MNQTTKGSFLVFSPKQLSSPSHLRLIPLTRPKIEPIPPPLTMRAGLHPCPASFLSPWPATSPCYPPLAHPRRRSASPSPVATTPAGHAAGLVGPVLIRRPPCAIRGPLAAVRRGLAVGAPPRCRAALPGYLLGRLRSDTQGQGAAASTQQGEAQAWGGGEQAGLFSGPPLPEKTARQREPYAHSK